MFFFLKILDSPNQERGDLEYFEGSWTLWGSSRDPWDALIPLRWLCNQAVQSSPIQFFWKACWMLISNLFKSSWEYNRDRQGINSPLKCWQPCCLSQWMKYWIYQSPIFHCSLHCCIFKLINHELCRLWYILWEHERCSMTQDTWSVASLEQSRCTSCWGACLTKVDGIKVNILLALYFFIFQSSSYLASVW